MRYDPSSTLSWLSLALILPLIWGFGWLEERASHPFLRALLYIAMFFCFWAIVGFNFGWFS